jgi:hypothetical protein
MQEAGTWNDPSPFGLAHLADDDVIGVLDAERLGDDFVSSDATRPGRVQNENATVHQYPKNGRKRHSPRGAGILIA